MRRGDRVIVYHDPITCKEIEGEAVLVHQQSEGKDRQWWKVRFIGDAESDTYCRLINIANH